MTSQLQQSTNDAYTRDDFDSRCLFEFVHVLHARDANA
jgi:hypothetical protein